MSKLLLVLVICSLILSLAVLSSASPSGFSLFGRRTTTTTTTTTLEPPTSKASISLWLENTIPKIEDGCTGHYVCKKKIKHGTGRVCVKYCLKKVQCTANVAGVPATINPDWCVTLNPDALDEPEPTTSTGTVSVMQVNMIDFPCQPGYLPDSRGRCREVW